MTPAVFRYDYLKPDSVLEKERLEEEEKEARKERISVEEMKHKPRIAVTGGHNGIGAKYWPYQ